jgi:pimeloyl-ACP methyl ester carboxylesterase
MQTGELERWRREVVVAERPRVCLSVIDIYPHAPQATVVLLHALGGQAADWAEEIEHFAGRYRVIAPDLRGHGASDRRLSWVEFEPQYGDWSRAAHNRDAAAPNDGVGYHYFDIAEGIRGQPRPRRRPIRYSRTLLLADLERMLAELRVELPFVLAGRCFGALLAAEYAKAHPAALNKLVLIGLQERYELKQEYKLLLSLPDRLLQAIAATPSASLAVVKNVYVNSLRGLDVKSAIVGLRPSRRIQSAAPELFFTE